MTTTQEWLNKVTNSKDELNHWLTRQYIGEVTAAHRIEGLQEHEEVDGKQRYLLGKIAMDESQHASWIKQLLINRGLELPEVTLQDAEKRYWKPVFDNAWGADDCFAAGAHAEEMRLHRIKAIVASEEIDEDIRKVFRAILPDEEWHAKAFKHLASEEALVKMKPHHEAGLKLLGLEV